MEANDGSCNGDTDHLSIWKSMHSDVMQLNERNF